ncbi:acetolactate synthase small subunit [Alicyclobacillus contaminans]|uniref:acetolactate synthase small subunit n=1 Tax=Alicyclobacillus contaminans TaxID=392016 RepID=UPI0003FA4659|nr:acetolactate synthase small subunit [Alicyclobacillus contaminans]GMA49782.1 acetolactate synthase small subunit [Alicyclobacillus contaminans]
MIRIITVIVNNRTGVLNRVTGLFLRRGFNIQSITVGTTETEELSRMTILLDVDSERDAEQVIKQLHKQIDVIKVSDITDQSIIARELVLLRVNSPLSTRAEIFTLIEPFRATVVDVTRESITIQATGHPDKIEALVSLLRPYGIKDLARTGVTAFPRETDKAADGNAIRRMQLLPL